MSSPASASSISPADLSRLALEPAPRTAVFDCDGTLWSGDAGSGFMRWTIETGLVSRETADAIDRRYRAYNRGEVSELAICGEMVQMYQGLREAELIRAAQSYVRQFVEPRIFPELRALLTDLLALGTDIWAVSSTNRWVIEQGVLPLGIRPDRILAADLRVTDGVLTHELLDVPTDEGKAVALRRVSLAEPDLVFGNSVHDAAMIALARRPFAINPTPALVTLAEERGWPIFHPTANTART